MNRLFSTFVIAAKSAVLGLSSLANASQVVRGQLTYKALQERTRSPIKMVDNRYFAPPDVAHKAKHSLSGVLAVGAHNTRPVQGAFPQFEVAFFSHDGYLVPTERDLIRTQDSHWDIILSPGRIWSEATDKGWSRAAFPFVLAGQTWNDSHNGLATFLFNDSQVTDLRFQIVQESATWSRFDAAGQLPFSYLPSAIDDHGQFACELAGQIPIKPWSDLEPLADPELLSAFAGRGGNVSALALHNDGVLYLQTCRTRFGEYPYCRHMRHGVYSVTKTAGAALSLFWLAQKFGDEVADEKIVDYVNVTAEHAGWESVTFLDTLDMATGIGDKAPNRDSTELDFDADERSPVFSKFASARGAAQKLNVAFSAGNYPWGPGEVGRYNSVHTFVLAAAMDVFLKTKLGPQANLWDRVSEEVLRVIGVANAPIMHTREVNSKRGVPIMGWGFYPTIEELARIASLFHNRGVFNGQVLISPTLLASVLPGPKQGGYEIQWHNAHGKYRYHKSFWLMPYESAPGCRHWIPEMMGFGGNLVTLMPNGMSAIRLADAAQGTDGMYDAEGMAALANAIRPFCD